MDGVFIRHGRLIGFFEDNDLAGNIMTLKIISASSCDGMGQITAPITPLPKRNKGSTSQSVVSQE